MIGVKDMFALVCSRGLGKSWIAGVAAVAIFGIFPYSEIVITSGTVSQGNKLAEKILTEIIKKNSPVLLYMYEHEYIVKTQSDDGWKFENKLNGSTIRVVPALDSARGTRATVIIPEEARLIKKSILDSVFRPMAHPRQAKFLENAEYGQDARWLEETKTIYLSSASYKYEWLYKTWKKFVMGVYCSKDAKYGVFAADIYTSMQNGLKTIGDFKKAKNTSSELSFRCEDLNEWIGENEDCFFSLKSFKENQVLSDCWRFPSSVDLLINGFDKYRIPKTEHEVRIVVADFAWTVTKKGNESDNSVVICMRGIWKNGTFVKHIDYVDLLPTADDSDGCAKQLKRIFWLYEADYLVPDSRSVGETIICALSKNDADDEYGGVVPARGLGIADCNYQVANDEKITYYKARAIDSNYVPCIIPIVGTAALNTAYWRATKQALERNNIKFLKSMADKQEELEDSGEYYELDSEELADKLAPYGQTDMLVIEAVNLKTEIRQDNIKLEAPKSGHRDRIVTLAMGVLIFSYIENEWLKQEQREDFDLNDFDLVF